MGEQKNQAKCVIWDLDGTIWNGTLLECETVVLRPHIKEIISLLDKRGILHSIASRNNYADAINALGRFGLAEYFLYPQIGWNPKSYSVACIKELLNIDYDSLIFVDDEDFERDEVQYAHPSVECINALEYERLTESSRLNPQLVTEDTARRRQMYLDDFKRKCDEEEFRGTPEEFLKTLNLKLIIDVAGNNDLERAYELTLRTHQFNATGTIYNYNELDYLRNLETYRLLTCELIDKYGSYGKIGLALIKLDKAHLHVKLLLVSCRVLSRGIGTILLNYILKKGVVLGKKVLADFKKNESNKAMFVAYKFANFKEIGADNTGISLLENDASVIQQPPSWVSLIDRWH